MISTITIQRRTRLGAVMRWVDIVKDIPISQNCIYVSELMSTEYVTLRWNSDSKLELQPGDAVTYNNVRYHIGTPVIPTITANGGYNYEQTFYAEWYFWRNKKVFYDRAIGVEAGWKMTQYPAYFLELILTAIDNINWSYQVDGDFTEMKLCNFSSGTDIISMLNTMADDNHWRTEWWVDSVNHVLHFGSCLDEENDPVEITDEYVQSVTRQQTSNKGNVGRLYVFGSTKNISPYYRKNLIFKAGNAASLATAQSIAATLGYQHGIVDDTRRITSDVFLASINVDDTDNKDVMFGSGNTFYPTMVRQSNTLLEGKGTSNLVVDTQGNIAYITPKGGKIVCEIEAGEHYDNKKYTISLGIFAVDENGNMLGKNTLNKQFSAYFNEQNDIQIGELGTIAIGSGNGKVYLQIRVSINSQYGLQNSSYSLYISNMSVDVDAAGNVKKTSININGNTYDATCVQRGSDSLSNSVIMYNGDYTPQVGDEYTLNNIAEYLLPASYFTRENNSVEKGVADNRLMLPEGVEYIETENHVYNEYSDQEGILVLEDIYPRMKLSVASYVTDERTEIDTETGVEKKWNAYQIHYTGMTFKDKYILDNTELRIIFQSGDLCGMDFAVKFNPNDVAQEDTAAAQVLEIARNPNYGLPIPNDTMHPKNNDQFLLYGFNTAYVDAALVPDAEMELQRIGIEVLTEAQKDNSTYECTMNPIRCMGYTGNSASLTKTEEGIYDLKLGRQVIYESSIYGTIESRIRKIERRLDDRTLKYSLGVSAPYSRLRELRTMINNIK